MDFPSSSRRVIITGVNGFTGYYLKALLEARGYRVFGIGVDIAKEAAHYFKSDIGDTDRLIEILEKVQPHYIFHLAAISFVEHSNVPAMYQINVLGTESLLRAVVASKVKPEKILLASSAAVYGDQNREVLDETLAVNPKNHYGISKWGMEQIARNFFDKLPILIVRPFNYTGVGQSPNFVIPKIIQQFKSRAELIELGNLDVFREFNHVQFVCELYEKLIHSQAVGDVVNVCSGRAFSLQQVLDIVSEISGHQLRVVQSPAFMRQNEIRVLAGNTNKLENFVGALPKASLKATLQTFFNH